MTDKLTDADLDELLGAADPLRHEALPSDTETDAALQLLLHAGPAAVPARAASGLPTVRTLVSDVGLWLAVVREHASDQSSRRRVDHWPLRLAGATIGVAAAATAVALLMGAATTSPAFAVTRNHDGTVTVSIRSYSGIAGANAKLHRLGIRARVMPSAPSRCRATSTIPMHGQGAPMRERSAHWTINPRKVPGDRTLVLTPPPEPNSGSRVSDPSAGQTWSCRATQSAKGAPESHPPTGPPPQPPASHSGNG